MTLQLNVALIRKLLGSLTGLFFYNQALADVRSTGTGSEYLKVHVGNTVGKCLMRKSGR